MTSQKSQVRDIPNSDSIKMDPELYYEDIQKENLELPVWRDLSVEEQDYVKTSLWRLWRENGVQKLLVLRKMKCL